VAYRNRSTGLLSCAWAAVWGKVGTWLRVCQWRVREDGWEVLCGRATASHCACGRALGSTFTLSRQSGVEQAGQAVDRQTPSHLVAACMPIIYKAAAAVVQLRPSWRVCVW
jgi:hypothetical protein